LPVTDHRYTLSSISMIASSSSSSRRGEEEDTSSSTSNTSPSGDEPPTFDEMLYDSRLYVLFARYLAAQQAAENVMFLRQVFQFRMYRAPHKELAKEARQIAWSFISEAAVTPVNVSSEERESLMEFCFDPESENKITSSVFHDAYTAIFNLVLPLYRDWIGSGEWREVGHFHHIPPPSFAIVLETPDLVELFSKYIKAHPKGSSSSALTDPGQLWQFCLIAKDFRDGKMNHAAEFMDSGDVEGKTISKEEYAKKLYRKYKHYMPIPRESSMPYSVYVVSALNKAIELFNVSSSFGRWITLKQYIGVDYLSKTIHQTMTPDGFAVPPTLAALLASPMRSSLAMLLKDTEGEKPLSFLLDLMEFENLARGIVPGKKAPAPISMDAYEVSSKKEVVDEAKRIYKAYLEDPVKAGIYCETEILDELKTAMKAVSKSKTVRSDIFHRAGAFQFQRLEKMFGREIRAGLAWTSKSYDNNCKRAREIVAMFDVKQLPNDLDYHIIPSADDMLANDILKKDFEAFIPKELSRTYEEYLAAYLKITSLPFDQRSSDDIENVVMLMAAGATKFKDTEQLYKSISKGLAGRKSVSNGPFIIWLNTLTRSLINQFYHDWVTKRASFWSSESWVPAKEITFSRMSSAFSPSDASGKTPEALTKKSSFSGLFGKRNSKKRTSASSGSKGLLVVSQKDSSAPALMSPTLGSSAPRSRSSDFGDATSSECSELEDSGLMSPTMQSALILPPIPSLVDTLSSTYLRKLFQKYVLEARLPDDLTPVWKAFSEFYLKYQPLSDSDIESSQDEMRAAALAILDKYESYMKKGYFLRSHIQKKGLITPSFFREEEMNQFRQYHLIFETFLKQRGWHSD